MPGIKCNSNSGRSLDWIELADGNTYCTECGAICHPASQEIHDGWHATIVNMIVRHNQLVRALQEEQRLSIESALT